MATNNAFIQCSTLAEADDVYTRGGGAAHCRMFKGTDGTYVVKVPAPFKGKLKASQRRQNKTRDQLDRAGFWRLDAEPVK